MRSHDKLLPDNNTEEVIVHFILFLKEFFPVLCVLKNRYLCRYTGTLVFCFKVLAQQKEIKCKYRSKELEVPVLGG